VNKLSQLVDEQARYLDALVYAEHSLTNRELAKLLDIGSVRLAVLNQLVSKELVSHYADARGTHHWQAIPENHPNIKQDPKGV